MSTSAGVRPGGVAGRIASLTLATDELLADLVPIDQLHDLPPRARALLGGRGTRQAAVRPSTTSSVKRAG